MNPVEMLLQDATPIQRKLLERVKFIPETECWELINSKSTAGVFGILINGKPVKIRKLCFEEFIGPIAGNDRLSMSCKNKKCTSPSHIIAHRWDERTCKKEALKYKTRNDFHKYSILAYSASVRGGWLDKICKHMVRLTQPKGYWTKEKCTEEAIRYKTKNSFYLNSRPAYAASVKNKWLDEVCSHMGKRQRHSISYWTKERCTEEALKYKTRMSFKTSSGDCYNVVVKNKWLNEVCSHMPRRARS